MARDIAIPKLGMTMKEAKVVAWMFNEGDRVEKDQVVMQVETAKVTHDVEAQASGFLHILVPPGETHPVGAAVGQLAETEAELRRIAASLVDLGLLVPYVRYHGAPEQGYLRVAISAAHTVDDIARLADSLARVR